MKAQEVERFARCLGEGGVGLFPADTVYGLACAAESPGGARRLYELKGRSEAKPAAVMFFDAALALSALAELGARSAGALERLLPGPVTVLVPNPAARFPLACAGDPATLGLRVPRLDGPLAPLRAVTDPVLQSSANLAGEPEPRTLADVARSIRDGADVALDGGTLPGIASTVVDLRDYEENGGWTVVREGALTGDELTRALA